MVTASRDAVRISTTAAVGALTARRIVIHAMRMGAIDARAGLNRMVMAAASALLARTSPAASASHVKTARTGRGRHANLVVMLVPSVKILPDHAQLVAQHSPSMKPSQNPAHALKDSTSLKTNAMKSCPVLMVNTRQVKAVSLAPMDAHHVKISQATAPTALSQPIVHKAMSAGVLMVYLIQGQAALNSKRVLMALTTTGIQTRALHVEMAAVSVNLALGNALSAQTQRGSSLVMEEPVLLKIRQCNVFTL